MTENIFELDLKKSFNFETDIKYRFFGQSIFHFPVHCLLLNSNLNVYSQVWANLQAFLRDVGRGVLWWYNLFFSFQNHPVHAHNPYQRQQASIAFNHGANVQPRGAGGDMNSNSNIIGQHNHPIMANNAPNSAGGHHVKGSANDLLREVSFFSHLTITFFGSVRNSTKSELFFFLTFSCCYNQCIVSYTIFDYTKNYTAVKTS